MEGFVSGRTIARWSFFQLVSIVMILLSISETFSFHSSQQSFQRRKSILRKENQHSEFQQSRLILSNSLKEQERDEHNDDPSCFDQKDSHFLISRRSAVTSMAVGSSLVTGGFPAFAQDENEVGVNALTLLGNKEDIGSLATMEEVPAPKEKTIDYTIRDFTVALPANWNVVTKYNPKKPGLNPTIFAAIDFNSGAVVSVVTENACSVNDYAKSSLSFEKSDKRCDFVLKNNEVFSPETYEKDATKLLVRHDDRDNAALRGISKMEDAKLTQEGGRLSLPVVEYANASSNLLRDSYSSSLLELSAKTTIPIGGTYRDAMGLEQPNTIDRKVLAKAVVTTTFVEKMADDTMKESSSSPTKQTTLEATSTATTTEPTATTSPTIETGKAKDESRAEYNSPQALRSKYETSQVDIVSSTAETTESSASNPTTVTMPLAETNDNSPLASAMMAMASTMIEEPFATSESGSSVETLLSGIGTEETKKTETTNESVDNLAVANTQTASAAAAPDIESPATPAVATTASTTVLSIWLSAPVDEWQKPVMGTKLNQIWESVKYDGNIIEGSPSLSTLPQDVDEENSQLLLMNNKALP